ncbi:MAG TPA: carboxypeptidase-like regulatory domain-containing protein [Pedobacter sp.]|uniref:TonB-dependent receptor n=1 Tax=Pedobacter sp. TaxID=1411316 RepID=UPI002CEED605|nr:carboxypeptidase-like regulatory domain-containing protein [Pedobacter sp.]HMI03481.1 carboxypeptidase-like regulatory domain-containing protein [Pedobacter sp.]
MSRLTFLVAVITMTLTGVILASGVKSQSLKEVKVSVNTRGSVLREILADLETKSGFSFVYSEEIGNISNIHLSGKTSTLYDVLMEISRQKGLRFNQESYLVAVVNAPPPPKPPTGSIKGRIVEFETSQPLPGTSVLILELNKGLQADNEGYYKISAVPPGKYTLQVSFISYRTEKITVEIKEGKESLYDVKLQGSNALNEVVIKSRQAFSKNPVSFTNDRELVRELKSAKSVVSGISNEQIIKSADRNAAEVVKRISGVTVTDERFIVVRGMNQRYNQTYLNGNIAPSTELYSRAFAYDLLPSPIIDRILIYKSPAADLFGDVAGGSVKIFTKNAKPVRHLDIGVQTAYRENVTFKQGLSYKGGKLDWLGFDDGTRKLSSVIPNFGNAYGKEKVPQQQFVNAFNGDMTLGAKKADPDLQVFGNFFDNFRIGNARLYNFTSFNYTRENRIQHVYRQTGNLYSKSFDQLNERNTLAQADQSVQLGRVNLMETLKLKLNRDNNLEFRNFFLNEGRKNTSSTVTMPNDLPSVDAFQQIRTKDVLESFEQRTLYSGNLSGEHQSDTLKKHHLQWNLGYNAYKQNLPDQRGIRFIGQNGELSSAGSNTNDYTDNFLGMINRIYLVNDEKNYNGSVDYTFTLNPAVQFKAGTYQLFKNRNVDRRFFKVNRAGLEGVNITENSPSGIHDNFGMSNPNLIRFTERDMARVWSDEFFRSDNTGLALYDATLPSDGYVASERNNTFYLMGDVSLLSKKLNINGGARMENDEQKLSAVIVDNGGLFTPILIKKPKTSWLPSVNASYSITDSLVIIRGGYGKTVNRPEFREISPFTDYDFINNEEISGNTNLVTAEINNYDLRFELYPRRNPNEFINVGVFYKELKNPIERIQRSQSAFASANGNLTNISFQNADKAMVYGAEAEIRKSLSFIPGNVFRNLSVVVNGAIIKSKASRAEVENATGFNSEFKDRPLQGQAPYVFNAGLFYENLAWGTKMSVMYNVSGPTLYAISVNSTKDASGNDNGSIAQKITRPNLLELPRNLLDFSLSQRVIKSLNARLNIQNLLNQSFRIAEDQNYDQKYTAEKTVEGTTLSGAKDTKYAGDNIFRSYNTNRYFILSLNYSF